MSFQDVLKVLFPKGGYFVEAGAHDGFGDSQTYELEQAGWKGVCVEPSSYFQALQKRRKCKVDNRALTGGQEGQIPFRELYGTELSGLLAYFQEDSWDRQSRPHTNKLVETVRLLTLLYQHRAPEVIEYLALDTEGSELAILQGHDFASYRFLVMQVEYNGLPERRRNLTTLLTANGYVLHRDDGTNLFLAHASVSEQLRKVDP